MGRINVMSPELANMIAAGEVIERPSSVIKELVENSIDALSTQILVEVEDAGRKLIKVQDDGCGMSKEDALLSFKRHASSKIKSVFDLMRITSLGFRGEAVPSIASISKVKCITSDGVEGALITSTPEQELKEEDSSLRKGTTFEVRELFFNTPARLKYLKSDKTENSSSIEVVEHLAMCYPSISFTLFIDGKLIFKTNGRGDLLEAIASIYGLENAKKMLPVKYEGDSFSFTGYICHPSVSYSTRYDILTFLNSRSVYVPKIQKAIVDGYKDYLPPNRYPLVVLSLEVDYSLVDVNVHPTKREVRLSIEDEISQVLYKAIKNTLVQTRNNFASVKIPEVSGMSILDKKEDLTSSSFENTPFNVEETKKDNQEEVKDDASKNLFDLFEDESKSLTPYASTPLIERPFKVSDSHGYKEEATKKVIFEEKVNFPEIYPLGQVLETYIICDSEDGLYIVDQHAAAERINFEKCEEEFKTKKDRVVPLFPVVIELPYSAYNNYDEKHIEALKEFNIYTSHFGGNTIRVDEIPSFLQDKDDNSVLNDIILEVLKDNTVNLEAIERLSIASKACKMSIKANHQLTHEQQVSLLKQLSVCHNPLNCPHGRPTIIKISKYDIEKLFKRTGF